MGLYQAKNILHGGGNYQKMKRPPIEGEKVFASGTYNKE